jgi:hypothetical protein
MPDGSRQGASHRLPTGSHLRNQMRLAELESQHRRSRFQSHIEWLNIRYKPGMGLLFPAISRQLDLALVVLLRVIA